MTIDTFFWITIFFWRTKKFFLVEGGGTYIHPYRTNGNWENWAVGPEKPLEDFYFGLGILFFAFSFAQFAQFAQSQSRFEVKQYSWYLG